VRANTVVSSEGSKLYDHKGGFFAGIPFQKSIWDHITTGQYIHLVRVSLAGVLLKEQTKRLHTQLSKMQQLAVYCNVNGHLLLSSVFSGRARVSPSGGSGATA
jgi:hypothetical protein